MKYLFIAIFLILPFSIDAQIKEYTLLEPLPCVQKTGNDVACDTQTNTISKVNTQTYIQYLYRFSFSFAVALAIVMIILGGFQYALSDAVFSKGEARERITNAFIGLIMLFGSYVILETIDPRLIEVKTELDPIEAKIEKVNYGQFFGEIEYASQLKELTDATKNSESLKKQAAELRAKADAEPDEEKSIQLRTDALELERESERIVSRATTKVLYEKFTSEIEKGGYTTSDLKSGKTGNIDWNARQKQMIDEYDAKIKKLNASGDVEGAQEIEKLKKHYVKSLEIDTFIYGTINDLGKAENFIGTGPYVDPKNKDKNIEIVINYLDKERAYLKTVGALSDDEIDGYINNKAQEVLIKAGKIEEVKEETNP